ncbi:MAG: lactate utilization protein C [Balneolaceae bacterium]|nr:lactate utilization protein C [Balneolaceae bacterium]
MSSAREEILAKVRNALADVPGDKPPGEAEVPRQYRRRGELPQGEAIELFMERVGEYRAEVKRIARGSLGKAIADACRNRDVKRLVVPRGFPDAWLPQDPELQFDSAEAPLSHRELDGSDGVITTCALAVAQTGTIFLDAGEGQGRRALTLVPDYHLCIVREDQIVELFPEAIAHFDTKMREAAPPITLISGPSATSDIELSRVEGVHGPRRLDVLVVGDG